MRKLCWTAVATLAASLLTGPASAESEVEGKLCLFSAAARLPTVPGLKILSATVRFRGAEPITTGGTPLNIYVGDLVVEGAGQKATYTYTCPFMPGTGGSGGLVFDRGMIMGMVN